jgi:hypothetical protein
MTGRLGCSSTWVSKRAIDPTNSWDLGAGNQTVEAGRQRSRFGVASSSFRTTIASCGDGRERYRQSAAAAPLWTCDFVCRPEA